MFRIGHWRYAPRVPYVVAWSVAVIFAVTPLLLETRRAIVFSAHEFVSRESTGGIVRVPFIDIANIEETSVFHMLGTLPMHVYALRLILKNGNVLTVPLDFPQRDEIVKRLRASVAADAGDVWPLVS